MRKALDIISVEKKSEDNDAASPTVIRKRSNTVSRAPHLAQLHLPIYHVLFVANYSTLKQKKIEYVKVYVQTDL